jgi:anti-sigma regulatory factor (Ser/Thr protein kinase)
MNAAHRQFPARLSVLNEAIAYVDEICLQAGMTNDEKMSVELVIEELFSNTVCHGYRQESNLPVWISSSSEHDLLHLVYQDQAPEFNPLTLPDEPKPERPGGWGMPLVKYFAHTAYRYEDERNTLTLTFKINRPVESPDTRAD